MQPATQQPESSTAAVRKRPKPGERRLQILQTIASMLQEGAAEKVTTAALAAKLSLSEAALYRHFASKAQMFEGLLDFIEETIFSLINQIESRPGAPAARAREIVLMLLGFAEKNPGMTRVLIGDAIVNEDSRLQARVNQLLERVEASIRQCLRLQRAESEAAQLAPDLALQSAMAMAFVQGRWLQFAKTGFRKRPSDSADAAVKFIFP
ncbi:MAG: nucleoid occlusion factor SlmA [Betaproteobacteria bacterium]|jgi:TetR/AcrR family transcriptional regulator